MGVNTSGGIMARQFSNDSFCYIFEGFFILIVGDFFFSRLFDLKVNGETDEFGVLFDQILQFSFFEEFDVVALDAEDDFRTSAKGWSIIFTDRESSTCSGFPSVLCFLFRRFGNYCNSIGN